MRNVAVIVTALALVLCAAMVGLANEGGGLSILCISEDAQGREVVVIFNNSPVRIDLTGYILKSGGDGEDSQQFEFRNCQINLNPPSIAPFDIVRVRSGGCGTTTDARDFFWITSDGSCRVGEVWNNKGDVARLFHPDDLEEPVAIYSYQNGT